MKKIITKIISFSLILATLLSVTSCGKNKNNDICYAGLLISLPNYMTKQVASDYGIYKNEEDGASVRIYYYSESQVAEECGAMATVKTYADRYAEKNDLHLYDEIYSEEKNTLSVKYTETVDGVEKFCYDYIVRNENTLYHVRMSCDLSAKSNYQKKFGKWIKSIKIADDFLDYSESGLNFSLPSYMKTISVPAEYADLCFSNSGDRTEFTIYFYSKEGLVEDPYINISNMYCTVKEYTDWFVSANGYENVYEEYDEANRKIILRYIYEPESTFYCDTVLRNDDSLIHVTMSCDADKRDVYEPIFNEWISKMSLVYS